MATAIKITIIVAVLYGLLILAIEIAKRAKDKRVRAISGMGKNLKKKFKVKKYNQKFIFALHGLYVKIPFLKKYYDKTETLYESIYPANERDITYLATKEFSKTLAFSIGCGTFIIMMAGFDFFYIIAGITLAYVMFTQGLSGKVEKTQNKLNAQFSDYISSLRHYYHDNKDVCDAIYQTLDECPQEIGLHINKIYELLLQPNVEENITEYINIAPNRFFKMFASICASTREYGDKIIDGGQWLFLENLSHLKEELTVEILKNDKVSHMFKGMKAVAIIPIFTLKLIERYSLSALPDLESFYNGGDGIIVTAALFAISLGCYSLVSSLRDGQANSIEDHVLLNRMANLPVIRHILTAQINRRYDKALRTNDRLKLTGEKIGPQEFTLKKYIYAAATAIVVVMLLIASVIQKRQDIIGNFADAYARSTAPNAEYRQKMEDISSIYMKKYKGDVSISIKEDLTRAIMEKEKVKRIYAEEIVDTMIERQNNLDTTFFKWYYLIFAALGAVIGYFIPDFVLKYRTKIVRMNMEDEVVQFQTLALMLMHVDGATVNLLLEWMERFAFCFRDSISTCIVNLESSTQEALQTMKDSESFPPFRRFCDNLMSIDSVGMVDAFDEIKSERDYYRKKREQDNEFTTKSKAQKGGILALTPLVSVIMGYIIYPFILYALQISEMMKEALTNY